MKLASAQQPDSSFALYVECDSGYVDVAETATRFGVTGLPRFADVGDLFRAGDDAVAKVRGVAAKAMSDAVKGMPLGALQLGPPVRHPTSIVCIGRNYFEHIKEGNVPVPEYPILFAKYPNTLVGHGASVRAHAELTEQLDYEGELCVVISRLASRVTAGEALDFVGGYTVLDDVSARDLQYKDLQWIRGKSLDTWCPLGPVVVTVDEIPDPTALRIETRVNGELRQNASCSDMLFKIPQLIEFITQGITLHPGDLIATGTPSGVGLGFDPPRWLSVDDEVDVTIEPIGTLHSKVIN